MDLQTASDLVFLAILIAMYFIFRAVRKKERSRAFSRAYLAATLLTGITSCSLGLFQHRRGEHKLGAELFSFGLVVLQMPWALAAKPQSTQ